MKKVLVISLIILLLVGCSNNSSEKVTVNSDSLIDMKEIKNMIDNGNATIVDVRRPDEYSVGHIKGAINIPYDTIDENVDLDKNKKILVYCKSGKRSGIAFNTLTNLGYDVYDMGAYANIELEKE